MRARAVEHDHKLKLDGPNLGAYFNWCLWEVGHVTVKPWMFTRSSQQ